MALSISSKPSSHLFTPIHEGNEENEETESKRHRFEPTTPKPRRPEKFSGAGDHLISLSCMDCRPNHREKTSVVVFPVDNSSSSPGIFKSLLAGISRRNPKSPAPAKNEEQWKIAMAELSNKLVQATKKRDEAILESSRLKYSMAELEKKLNRLEIYCDNLKSGLETCGSGGYDPRFYSSPGFRVEKCGGLIVENFLNWVSQTRYSIRFLSKSLTSQLKLMGNKVFERLSSSLRVYDINISSLGNGKNIQVYLEALLNATFFDQFESVGFDRNSMTRVLNPIERSETKYEEFNLLKDLCWDEVLSKGTKHFSEEFSRFCDRKMSEIVAMLGWNRAWPEQLLQAFFGASKSVWMVHLLANSVHPSLTIFRVDKAVPFDPVYMEDMGGDKVKKLVPIMVKIMVEPGFYVYDNVVKCKVLCKYYNSSNYGVFSTSNGDDDNKISQSPP